MRIIVLGATGFIGRNAVLHYAQNGHEVHAVRNSSPEYECENVTWHKIDLRSDHYSMHSVMEGADLVIQAAATTSGSKDIVSNPAIHVTDNAVMNSYIFRAAAESGVKHLIFPSCTVMYGSSTSPQDEDAPINIHPRYFGVARTKLYCEKLCEFYSSISSTKFTVIRHSNIYGPHDKFDLERSHVMGATITKVMKEPNGSSITVWGTGEEKRDLLYIDDLLSFIDLAVEGQKEKYALYNCGYGLAFSINDLVARIIELSGKKLEIKHDLSAPTIPTSLSLNCEKARLELGWNPKITLPEGITRTIDWWRLNEVKTCE